MLYSEASIALTMSIFYRPKSLAVTVVGSAKVCLSRKICIFKHFYIENYYPINLYAFVINTYKVTII